jgi:magnesium chelatase family protein
VQKYLNRISGPLLDRIDIHIEVVPVPFDKLSGLRPSEPSAAVRNRVTMARNIQTERFRNYEGIHSNSQLTPALMREHCNISKECNQMLKIAMEKLGLSARAYDRIIKVSRTIADLEESPDIQPYHLAEAIQYRSLDRESWAG